jgi:4-hydroxy-tetrahydrodipicolinate reductase
VKIGLFGHGKMGQLVARLAPQQDCKVVEPMDAEVCIDFSHATVVLEHITWSVAHQKPLVIGTTGWQSDELSAREIVERGGSAVFFAPNFSFGMACFQALLKQAQALLPEYAIAGLEIHHHEKQDAPSGTAQAISSLLKLSSPFASIRLGHHPGKHTLIFDSPFDSITLTHKAHNREGFALGALKAARWIQGKTGWYTIDDLFRDLYSTHYPF